MKIIGIQDYATAKKIKEKEILENKQEIKEENLHLLLLSPIAMLAGFIVSIVLIFLFCNFGNPFANMTIWKIVFMCACVIISECILLSCRDTNKLRYYYEFSPIWQYADCVDGKFVLHREIEYSNWEETYYLWLDLEDNKTKQVSKEKIGPFRKVIQTDVTEIVVDLEKSVIIEPYKKGWSPNENN